MHLNKHLLLIASISFAFILANVRCVDTISENPPTSSTIEISLIEVGCTSVDLSIRSTDGLYNKFVALFQNDSLVASFTLQTDTVVLCSGLRSKTNYSFRANHAGADAVSMLTTLDSTSHAVQWMPPDTIAPYGAIDDIWIFDKNNIWAVGEFFQKNDGLDMHNLAIWDGSKWQLKKVYLQFRGNNVIARLSSIYAFSSTDIWFVAGGRPIHGDGTKWTVYDYANIFQYDSISISSLWGNNTSAMSFVGETYNASNYLNGKWSWSTLAIATQLLDIYGVNATTAWAVGTDFRTGFSGIVQFDGTDWNILYDNRTVTGQKHYPYSVWSNNTKKFYVVGPDGVWSYSMITRSFTPHFRGNKAYMESIRGTDVNDIFIAGHFGELYHFNGSSWYQYQSPWLQNNDVSWLRKIVPKKDVVAIAAMYYREVAFVPIVFRGYR
jgi:hypothetical protein